MKFTGFGYSYRWDMDKGLQKKHSQKGLYIIKNYRITYNQITTML